MKSEKCPICGKGPVTEHVTHEESIYKGKTALTPLYFAECGSCGSEYAGPSHTKANKEAFITFKKWVDKLQS